MKRFKEYINEIVTLDEENIISQIKKETDILVDSVYSNYTKEYHKGQPEVVGWMDGSGNALVRNEVLYESGIQNTDSILDIGCGVAHFYYFLKNQGWAGEYLGIDPNLEAIRLIDEEINTKCGTIDDLDDSKYDWVIASGIFNIGIQESHAWWIIENMMKRAEKGVVFNMLKHPYISESYESYIPEEVETKLKEFDHKKIEIVEGYFSGEEEFTVYFYKETK